MNKVFSYLRRSMVPLLAVATAGLLFSACLKDKDNDTNDVPAAGLMTFNLAPDQQSVVVTLSNNTLTRTPLAYTNYSGVYQPIYVGNRTVDAFDYPETTPLASTSFNFEQDKYYSLFVVGNNNSYRNVISHDNIDSLSASNGKAYIRYINGITDSVNASTVTISAGGSNVVNDNAAYASVSQFTSLNPGEVTIAVKNSNGVDANRNITVEQNKVYTVLLTGVPGETDDSKKVQIKYILNGTLTDEQNK
jgi:hypothetical protein